MKLNKQLGLIFTLGCFALPLSAQTIKDAQRLYLEKKYEEAKPIFKKYVTSNPSNGNYNYWYGVCCYETGHIDESVVYLKKGVDRKVANAYLFLAKAYQHYYRFDEATDLLNQYIGMLEKRKESTAEATQLLDKMQQAARMLRGVENITVVDSFIVDAKQFLTAMKLSKEAGEIRLTNEGDATQFTNEMNDKMILSKRNSTGYKGLYSSIRLIDKWSEPEPIKMLNNSTTNYNYPFVDSDGITLYFASDSQEGLGGYDIYVTRYDSESNSYLKPDNIGFPFNSPYNDYMLAIDDFNDLGWFVSDRFQPEGKVCVYVFVPNEEKIVYDYDAVPHESLMKLAQLSDIKMTQANPEKIRLARQRLTRQKYTTEEQTSPTYDFTFIINDRNVYHSLDDFRSDDTKSLFNDYLQKQRDIESLNKELTGLRQNYQSLEGVTKKQYIPAILDLEKRIKELYLDAENLKKLIIQKENKILNP